MNAIQIERNIRKVLGFTRDTAIEDAEERAILSVTDAEIKQAKDYVEALMPLPTWEDREGCLMVGSRKKTRFGRLIVSYYFHYENWFRRIDCGQWEAGTACWKFYGAEVAVENSTTNQKATK